MQSFDDISRSIFHLLGIPKDPPGSAIFILLVAFLTAILSAYISRKFIDLKKLKLYTRKTKEFQKLQRKSLRSSDPILKKKVENQKSTSTKMQSELMKMRMKPMLFTFIPLILIFFALSSYYGNTQTVPDSLVANVPFDLPEKVVVFDFGVNCNYQRAVGIGDFLKINEPVNVRSDINTTQYNSLPASLKLCLDHPELHYVPTYIGWYIAINIVINSLITKVAGLNPE